MWRRVCLRLHRDGAPIIRPHDASAPQISYTGAVIDATGGDANPRARAYGAGRGRGEDPSSDDENGQQNRQNTHVSLHNMRQPEPPASSWKYLPQTFRHQTSA